MNKKYILSFETSCDDTSVAVVDTDYVVLSNLISSQKEHEKYGGIVPELASRIHIKNIMLLTKKAMIEAGVSYKEISAIAVSINPGLIGSLLVGVSYAKSLSYALDIPLIAINHLLGHVFANKITHRELEPPFLSLIVSGGHTELVKFEADYSFETVGKTRDDAAGEAFDKTAKLLNLGYPGGPAIQREAQNGDPNFYQFPLCMNQKDNFDFSFSGLKTAIMNYINSQTKENIEKHKSDIAASVQSAIVGSLFKKTISYAKKYKINKIVVSGGVSANAFLRLKFEEFSKISHIKVFFPKLEFCMDNAAMIGAAAIPKFIEKDFSDLSLNAFSKKGIRRL